MESLANLGPYTGPSCPPSIYDGTAKMVSVPTLKDRLDDAVKQAELRLKAVQEAREIFSRNPDMEKLLNLMQRGLF